MSIFSPEQRKKSLLISANVLTKHKYRQSSAVPLLVPSLNQAASGPRQAGICKLVLPQGPSQIMLKELREAWKHISLPSCLSGRVHRSKGSVIKTNLWSCQTSIDLHFKSGLSFEQTLSKRKNEFQQEPSWIKGTLLSIQTGTTELWWIISAGGSGSTRIKCWSRSPLEDTTIKIRMRSQSSITTSQDHYGRAQRWAMD